MSYFTISIFSKSAKKNYQWLMDYLQKSELGNWLSVRSVYGSIDHHLFNSEMLKCQFAILYHARNRGQIYFTDVADSLYDCELKALSDHLGKENVIVVGDDVLDSSSAVRERTVENQPSIGSLARDLFLFREEEKDYDELLRMKAIIHESIARIGLVEDGKPVFENKDEEKWKNQRRKSMAERISLFENSKPLNKNEDEESWQIQRKKILGAVKNKDQEMKQIQQKKLLEEMKAVLKGLNPNHENEPGGVQQAQKKGAVQEKDTLVKDFQQKAGIEDGKIQKDQKKNPVEKKDTLVKDFQQKAGIEDGKIQKDQKKNPVEKKNTLVKDFQHKAGIEDGEIQKDQKKNPVEIQVPVKKVENKDSGIEEDQKKIPVGVPLPQVQFVPEKEILIDERFKLGAGSFGTVYKGSYQGTPAAVKKIVCSNEDFNDIFLEIQVSISLNHTHIVKLMAAARTDTHILLANEYIHGDNLERILHSPNSIVQISEEDKLYVGLEMSLAIQYIHSKNIIHKDIKPANILVEARTKKTRLTDWGMANLRVAICTQMYQMIGPSGGTVAYMAPECVMDSQPATKMSDMWSVGATIAELFTKQKPWNTYTEIFHDMFLKLPPRPLASMNLKQLPIVKTCLSYDPKQRPTASDMVIAMKNMEGVDLTKRYGYTW